MLQFQRNSALLNRVLQPKPARIGVLHLGAASIVALVAAVLLPLIGSWQIVSARNVLLADARQDARSMAHSLAQHAARTIEGIDLTLSDVADRLADDPSGPALKADLDRRTQRMHQSRGIAVIDATGALRADSFPPGMDAATLLRPNFDWHRDHASQDLQIGRPVRGSIEGSQIIPVTRRIDAKDGAFGGMVATVLLPDFFQAFYDSLEIGPKGTLTLYSGAGLILARHPTLAAILGRDISHTAGAAAFLHEPSGIVRSISPIDGIDRIYAFEHVDLYPLIVSAAISVDDALNRWRHEATMQGVVIGLASIALLILAAVLERYRRFAARSARFSQETDRKYRLITENSSDLIILQPGFSGPKSYVSPSSVAIVGWSPRELAALPVEAFIHPEDLAEVRSGFAGLTPERPRFTSVHRLRHKDGHYIWVEAHFQRAISEAFGESVAVAARDVTARHFAEQALKDSEARYRLLAESASDMVSRADLNGLRNYVSPASIEILGYAPDAVIGTTKMDFIHPEDAPGFNVLLDRMKAGTLDQAQNTHRLRHKDGRWVWVEVQLRLLRDSVSGAPAQIVSGLRDVTQREVLRQKVEAGARLLRMTLDSMQQGLIVLSACGRVRIANGRALELLGLPQQAAESLEDASLGLDSEVHAWLLAEGDSHGAGPRQHQFADGRSLEIRRTAMPEGEALLTVSDITYLKRAESEARAANRRLLMAEEIAHVGHWRFDLTDAKTLSWSDEVYRIHGRDPAIYLPTVETAIAFYHEDDRAEVERCIAAAVAERRGFTFNLRIRRPDGEIRQVLVRGICEVDSASGALTGLFGAILDVTDLTQAQGQLFEKSAHLEATLETMDQGLIKVSAAGSVELTNRRFREWVGLPAVLLSGPSLQFAAANDDLDQRGEFLASDASLIRRLREAPLAIGTVEHMRPNGQILEMRSTPLADGSVVAILSDITARRQAESALRESEARYRMLADSTSDVIIQLDLDFLRRYVSPACRAVLGYEPAELIGTRALDSIHPEDANLVRSVMELLMSGAVPGDRATTTSRLRHKLGHWVWLEAGINLARDPDSGAPTSLICALRDVTERQRAARHLEQAKAAAENAAQIKADFVANMSHELRTPLTGILGIHDLLRSDPTLGPKQRHHLDLAYEAGRSLLTIVNDVLDFSKIEAGQLSIETIPFDLTALIEACRDFGREAAAPKRLRVEAHAIGPPTSLLGDPNRIRQILLNLLTNAVKFTERGHVRIEAGYSLEQALLRVEVTDTGIGIAEDKLPMLFGRFSQADASITRRYGGTGLGLAICKRLVELMGGQIGVTSKLGQGSTFWFELPLEENYANRKLTHAELRGAQAPSRRILLAEDNPINQEIIAAMLERGGHAVTRVCNGAAAVAAFLAGSFDVILLDLQMPVMDGLSAARTIRSAEANDKRAVTPMIGLTANAMADDIEQCRAAGMDAHVAKPIEWPTLFAAIDRLAAREAPRSAPQAHPVLDAQKLDELATYINRDRLGKMLGLFVIEVERRLVGLDSASTAELLQQTHSLTSLAGHFGFMQLSRLCADIDEEARRGELSNRIEELRGAAERAVAAAKSSAYARSA